MYMTFDFVFVGSWSKNVIDVSLQSCYAITIHHLAKCIPSQIPVAARSYATRVGSTILSTYTETEQVTYCTGKIGAWVEAVEA